MNWALFYVAALEGIASLALISQVGKDRGVLKPGVTAITVAINAVSIIIIAIAAVHLT